MTDLKEGQYLFERVGRDQLFVGENLQTCEGEDIEAAFECLFVDEYVVKGGNEEGGGVYSDE